ncbi:putative two-component system response regulator [Gordonia polyisoprenivorans VH2]|uniref:Putative two-component system response regulator n=1 Tax=Gordonia polyisoprenivorans (strain DSM 44266 / VH2) TaxID=1112204 RepID=H6MV06_GORPV|nr:MULTISPECIES: response regulator transcription factor [Gordonia]AFA71593.1 putative two-component system response regulator [Gordonia polyisoprenivorans VH2]MBE7191300.1 response regulator transcription factor [Gordonia polyisoprenivorans]MDF3282936.1 response regulator transcription factor [Gordonia sp. N1V]QUD82268.1 response regulator transcription factor [Gordonia polyisoprenivorans]
MTVTVVIADDQTVVREGLRSMLSLFDTIEVLGVAASAESALDLVAGTDPDVLLTDLRMPGIGGIEGIRRLRADGSRTAAVALTTYDDDTTIVEALDAGAVGFLNKDADPEAIEAAVLAAAGGRSMLDEKALRAVLSHERSAAQAAPAEAPDGLTEREVEVLGLIAQAMSNQQIAAHLVVGVSTVKTHVNHLLAKTACRDRAALVAYAYRHGLV